MERENLHNLPLTIWVNSCIIWPNGSQLSEETVDHSPQRLNREGREIVKELVIMRPWASVTSMSCLNKHVKDML